MDIWVDAFSIGCATIGAFSIFGVVILCVDVWQYKGWTADTTAMLLTLVTVLPIPALCVFMFFWVYHTGL